LKRRGEGERGGKSEEVRYLEREWNDGLIFEVLLELLLSIMYPKLELATAATQNGFITYESFLS
jgi:hypothetical protein